VAARNEFDSSTMGPNLFNARMGATLSYRVESKFLNHWMKSRVLSALSQTSARRKKYSQILQAAAVKPIFRNACRHYGGK
jgi:hypothetical protein